MAKSFDVIYIDGSVVHNCILETDTYWHKMYVFVSMFAFFCLPLLVLMLVYWLISRRLIRENVTTMDTARDNLIDSRYNARQATTARTNGINGINVASIFSKHSSTKSQSPLLSFAKAHHQSHHHYDFAEAEDLSNRVRNFNHHAQQMKLDREKMNSPLSKSSPNHLQRERLRGGKALSLDYQGCKRLNGDNEHVYESKMMKQNEPPSRPRRLVRQPCWSASTETDGHGVNYRSSIVDATATTTTTTTTSLTYSELGARIKSHSSREFRSVLGGLVSGKLNFVARLLNLPNMSSKIKSTDDSASDKAQKSEELDGRTNRNDIDGERDHAKDLNGHGDGASTGLNVSSTPCDSKLIEHQEERSDENQNQDKRVGQRSSFGIVNAHSRLVDSISSTTNCKSTINEAAASKRSDESKTGTGKVCYHDRLPHDWPTVASSKLRRTRVRGASFSHSKRALKGNNKGSIRDHAKSGSPRFRSKLVKGISVSSSTGSTYTNSTGLPSETSSATPSLHISNKSRSSPSPPRPSLIQQSMARRTTSTSSTGRPNDNETEPLVCNLKNVTDNMIRLCDDQRKAVVNHDGQMQAEPIGMDRSNYPSRLKCNRAQSQAAGANSRSSSVTYQEADNIFYSDVSSSTSLSIGTESADKVLPPWLDPSTVKEHPNRPSSQYNFITQSSRHNQIHQRRLSQHREERPGGAIESVESANDPNVRNASASKQLSDPSLLHNLKSSQPLEIVVDEDNATIAESSPNGSIERVERFEKSQTNHEALDHEDKQRPPTTTKTRVTRSLTDDQTSAIDAVRDQLKATDACKQFSRDSTLPLPVRESSGRHSLGSPNYRFMSKINLISMAHSLSDNLSHKKAGQRSGSHPIVSNQVHLTRSESNGLHTEFMVVRDISKKQQMDSRRQVVAMLAFVVACFFLLFFPYRVFTIWLILSTDDQVQSLGMETYYNLTYFSRILIYLHSAINPIAYNLISTKFRRAFMSILLCRGAATRRNFNVDHRYVHEPKHNINNNKQSNRLGMANSSPPRPPIQVKCAADDDAPN
jgi:hypothetical protein